MGSERQRKKHRAYTKSNVLLGGVQEGYSLDEGDGPHDCQWTL